MPEFIQISPSKQTVEIPFKRKSAEELQTIESPPTKKIRKKSAKAEKREEGEREDNKDVMHGKENIELIITEKPQAALKIANSLAEGRPIAKKSGKITYYELNRGGKKILVGCAVGHLFSLFPKEKGWPIFNLEWLPSWEKKGSEFTKQYLDTLRILAKRASKCIIACDYDIEGEVIGLNVMRYVCHLKDAYRMKFSTLTKEDIIRAYENMSSHIDWGLAYAGETRHYLDWLYGINLSRALMSAIKKAGFFTILSIGRVQGPALALIVKKEKEIMKFKSTPYWQISLLIENSNEFLVKHTKDITDKKELEAFKRLKGKKGFAATTIKEEKIKPPVPFDLTTLQIEAYRLFGITPAQLLQITQQLYLAGLISYPRTSSQKLPASVGYERIMKKLPKDITRFAINKKPIEGKKSDPAHPSIYPTGEEPENLTLEQRKVYDLIVRRFVSCFCNDATISTKNITIIVDERKFTANGLKIKEKGWMNVYNAKVDEKDIPTVDGEVTVKEVKIDEKMTQPPHRYSAASLVSELAKRNLGTKATRALIIDTLYKRGYIEDKQIKATPLGISVTDTLDKYSPLILDEKLTRKFEKGMDAIQTSKKGEQEQKKILDEAKDVLTEIAEHFKKHEENIGKDLADANKEKKESDKIAARIMLCPKCRKGYLVVRRNKRGQQFLACDAYPNCKTTFSLPPYGLVKKTDKICSCGFPILMTIRKGKRPWEFCFNRDCPEKAKKAREKAKEGKEKAHEVESSEIADGEML